MYCRRETNENVISEIKNSIHSPNEWRVLGSIVNSPGFIRAFRCKMGDKMYKNKMNEIW